MRRSREIRARVEAGSIGRKLRRPERSPEDDDNAYANQIRGRSDPGRRRYGWPTYRQTYRQTARLYIDVKASIVNLFHELNACHN